MKEVQIVMVNTSALFESFAEIAKNINLNIKSENNSVANALLFASDFFLDKRQAFIINDFH
jgi:hypothetical protein